MKIKILGTSIDPISPDSATQLIEYWANRYEARTVLFANVHMIMESYDSPEFQEVVNTADLVVPDGMPLVWILRRKGIDGQQRVSGYGQTLRSLEAAELAGTPVGFLGSNASNLANLRKNVLERFPLLKIAYSHSPPFRNLSEDEDTAIIAAIEKSGAQILFVGLGCPKQERWMFSHRKKVKAVMLGVGAAFDILGGSQTRAPTWMRKNGLEWLYRVWQEPKRLWKRYLIQNPRFLILTAKYYLGSPAGIKNRNSVERSDK